jgi:hypothetical protein
MGNEADEKKMNLFSTHLHDYNNNFHYNNEHYYGDQLYLKINE